MGGNPVNLPDGKPDMAKVLCVEVSTAHDPLMKVVMKVTELHKTKYKRFWDAFNSQEDFTKVAGTPLNHLKELDLIQQYQIQGMNILSIEQLADVHEGLLLQYPWLRHWKNQAQGYMIEHKPKPDDAVKAELAELRAQVAMLSKSQPAIVEAVTPEEKQARETVRRRQAAAGKPDIMNPKKDEIGEVA
jgi:hypothetical protein